MPSECFLDLHEKKHVTSASFKCQKMSATMVVRQRKFLILDGLKHSQSTFPCLEYSAKVDNDFDHSCHDLICYYGFSIESTVVEYCC